MENENTDRTLQIALGSYDRKELRVQKNYLQEQCAGSECTCFQNGSRLLEQLQQGRRFDAVILCSQLEDMSGLELLTELRTTEARPPVLMIDEARRQNSSILCPESGDGFCYVGHAELQKPAVGAVPHAGTAEPADGTQVSGTVRGLGNPAAGHE
ncbi:MAG: response regulator [Faecalibacterium sp.]